MAQFDLRGVGRPAWMQDFQSFIMRGNVIDLAVGIIIGAAFTGIVGSLVKDILNPILGLIVGGIDFTNIFITLKGPHAATLAEAQKAGAVTINVGVFINAIINFLIVAFAVFWLVRVVSKLYRKPEPAAAAPAPPPPTEVLLTEIRDLLRAQQEGTPVLPKPAGSAD